MRTCTVVHYPPAAPKDHPSSCACKGTGKISQKTFFVERSLGNHEGATVRGTHVLADDRQEAIRKAMKSDGVSYKATPVKG